MRRVGVLVAALTLLGCPWASAASDAAMDVDCTSNVDASLSPGPAEAEGQSVTTVVDKYDPCTSTDSTLKSGRRHLHYFPTDSCSPNVTTTTGTEDIVWNNGQVSTWEYTREVAMANGSVTIRQKGKITAGLFAGDNANEELTVLIPAVYLSGRVVSSAPPGREGHGDVADGDPDSCQTADSETKPGGGGAADRRLATGRLQISKS
ncbi:MAG: hypothetical protein ACRDZ3_17790 [Acidimicrobiia bacterium]